MSGGACSFFIFIVAVAPLIAHPFFRGDIEIFFRALQASFEGSPVYFQPNGSEHTKPPLATLLFLPFYFWPRPFFYAFWDLLNVIALPILIWRLLPSGRKWRFALASVFFVLGPWIRELAYGQYNLITFLVLLLTPLSRSWLQGPMVVGAVLLKPTNVIFLPWVYAASDRKHWAGLSFSCFATLAGLSMVYALVFGGDAFMDHHRQYLQFAPLMHLANIEKPENFGLCRLLVSWIPSLKNVSAYFFLLGTIVSFALCTRWRNAPFVLPLIGILVVLTSPMVWFQNYVLMLPAAMYLLDAALRAPRTLNVAWLGLSAVFLGTQLYNPTLLGLDQFQALRTISPPVCAGFAAMAAVWWVATRRTFEFV